MFSSSATHASRHTSEHDDDWLEPKRPTRDLKKIFLVCGLGALSWVATYVGMLELVQANMGSLDFTTKIVIGFSVAMLMTMIIWLLDQMFAPHPFAVKVSYVAGYIFLTMISVGFGFGFYWKVLESRSEASRSAESAVSQVQAALLAGSSRLDQLQGTLEQLTLISQEKAILEREKGTSCPNSRPGDGPRRRLRDDDAGRFSFASNFVKGRSTQVKADMGGLNADLQKITSADPSTFDKATGTRNKFLQALSRKLELTATSFNAFRTDPQLRQMRSELAERANRSTFPTGTGSGTFSCPDGQLQSALLGVVKAIDQLPELNKPEIATVEGAQAVVEAFRRLTVTGMGLLAFKLPPSADELRALQTQAVRSVQPGVSGRSTGTSDSGLSQGGLSQRDYIPLAIAAFVDICLLLVSIGRPMNRLSGLVPKMRAAERGPVYQILSKFDDIHRDPAIREKFEVFRHVVFDYHGDYYVAVPLDAPRNRNPDEVKNLQLEAHLLGNLFASFEKEKIFSRVYNPLLSSKMIQKKLWRQGSKFASSQAFRTYRFRDGAWSDIILGAVMGAARRAQSDRARAAQEAGPQIAMPELKTGQTAEQRARDIIAATVGEQAADLKEQLMERPLVGSHRGGFDRHADVGMTGDRRTAEPHGSAFGPYAGVAMMDDEPAAGRGATDRDVYRRDGRAQKGVDRPISWPYRRPPAAPGEADVDLLPANSNTSPIRGPVERHAAPDIDRTFEAAERGQDNVTLAARETLSEMPAAAGLDGLDNVIVMPRPGATAGSSAAEGKIETAGSMPSLGSGPVSGSTSGSLSGVKMMPPPLPSQPVSWLAESNAGEDLQASMNVRITQRTADFQIPVRRFGGAGPSDLIGTGVRTGVRTAFAFEADVLPDDDQLALDFQAQVPVQKSDNTILIADDRAEAVPHVGAADAIRDDVVTVRLSAEEEEPSEAFSYAARGNDEAMGLSDDDLEEISRRFAPKRHVEST